ncbi:MAG TPA: nuclear transport factor 2 family protein [Flavobacterium sp.]|uniref:nuclear transport factor 2 family protein n=1 Tax=Flavobacterium sp. TaxID=239 RepID=UPI002B7D4376|nr:nuclear transport factor 2 family protein [Flavobacterium sp.]HSD13362.1 nuclear transport factor 2 family protein [Flavobacterium sp.]
MMAKALVSEFYQSGSLRSKEVLQRFLHDEMEFHWYSSKGFLLLKKSDLIDLSGEMERSYSSSRIDISHLLQDGNMVTVRFTYYVTPIETPSEESVLAHFVTIWEVKEDKLFRGYQMSQLG